MFIKIINLILVVVLLSLSVFAQEYKKTFGWDLTYSSILKANNIGPKTFIRKWLALGYDPPAKKWISEWKGDPIISSILIEHANFHAAEYTTMWLFRTKANAYCWQDIENVRFSNTKDSVKPYIYDKLFSEVSSWKQAKPAIPKSSQSIPGYMGFINIYSKNESRQMLLSQDDFFTLSDNNESERPKIGRMMLALEPIILNN